MSKQHRDFVILVRGGVEINALVAVSHDVFTPATQTEPATTVEHLTIVYLEPAAGGNTQQTGEALRNSIKVQIDVPPVDVGKHFGWKEVPNMTAVATPEEEAAFALRKSSGDDQNAGDWTKAGMDIDGFPVVKGSAEDVTKAEPLIAADEFVQPDPEVIAAASNIAVDAQFKTGEKVRFTPESGNDTEAIYTIDGGELGEGPDAIWFWRLIEMPGALFRGSNLTPAQLPSAADLDAHAAEQTIAAATSAAPADGFPIVNVS